MEKKLLIIIMIMAMTSVCAKDLYVRPDGGSYGAEDGSSWTNAFDGFSDISWSSVTTGDTIWVAGGKYGVLVPGKSGNADTDSGRIFIKRATASAHGSETGWNSGFDSQVILTGIHWTSQNTGSYVTIDGQVDSGMRISQGSGDGALVDIQRGVSYITIRYLDLAGPCGGTACFQGGDNRNIDTTAWNGNSYEVVDHFVLQHSRLHGGCTLVWAMNVPNSIWEYNKFYDNDAIDSGSEYSPNECHPNIMATSLSDNIIFRFNEVYNYGAEGIMYLGKATDWYIYGNIWRDRVGGTGYARVLEAQGGTIGPVYFYNNVMSNIWIPIREDASSGGSFTSDSQGRNNIYWNNAVDGGGLPSDDYDFCSGSCSGTHSISSGSNPFANLAGKDFHIVSTVGTKFPKDKGMNLGSQFNKDMDGKIRGSDGSWDIGAYEYSAGGTCTPSCSGKQCGDNGCGGSCGACQSGYSCNSQGQCIPTCTPSCSGKSCGDNGCGGTCGTCTTGQSCVAYQCITQACTPNWVCTAFGTCANNVQTRTCTDGNSCGTTAGKPVESQSCVPGTIGVGSRVQVSTSPSLRVRSSPGTADATVLGTQAYGAKGTVIGGPTSLEGYTWWQIDYDTGVDGWSIEGSGTDTFLTLSMQCAHEADSDCDGCIEQSELLAYITLWKSGNTTLANLMEAIRSWKNGC